MVTSYVALLVPTVETVTVNKDERHLLCARHSAEPSRNVFLPCGHLLRTSMALCIGELEVQAGLTVCQTAHNT
jgi:hypothetical protein